MAARRSFGLVPHLVVKGGAKAIEFYKKALGAEEISRVPEQGGGPRLMHATLKIGDATLFLCDDFPEYCGGVSSAPRAEVPPCITLHLDVANCDAAIDRAVTAGATIKMPASDMFWGDRYGQVTDPFGHAADLLCAEGFLVELNGLCPALDDEVRNEPERPARCHVTSPAAIDGANEYQTSHGGRKVGCDELRRSFRKCAESNG